MCAFQIRDTFIPYNLPDITDQEVEAVAETVRSKWLAKGPRTMQFEKEFAEYVGARYAVAMNSCSAALHVALLAQNLQPGDEVITTPMTFACTAKHHCALPGPPRFLPISTTPPAASIPTRVAKKITPRTRRHCARYTTAARCATWTSMYAIGGPTRAVTSPEDAAHALWSRYKGRLIGQQAARARPATAFTPPRT